MSNEYVKKNKEKSRTFNHGAALYGHNIYIYIFANYMLNYNYIIIATPFCNYIGAVDGTTGIYSCLPRPQTQYLLHPPRLPCLPLPSHQLCVADSGTSTSTSVSRRIAALPLLFLCGNVDSGAIGT